MDKKRKTARLFALLISALSVIVFALNFVKLMLQKDEALGLLKSSGATTAFDFAAFFGVLLILLFGVLLTKNIYKELSGKSANKTMILGVSMIIAAFCFIIQGSMDIISALSAWRIEVISLLTSALSLIAGIAFAVRGFEMIQLAPKKHFTLYVIPVIWATISLLNLILTYPMYVSYQSLTEKLLASICSLLLLYCVSKKELGYSKGKDEFFGTFFIAVSSGVITALSLPYALGFLCGAGDVINNTPHLAYFGLSVYGFVAMLSYVFASESKEAKEE